MSNIIISYNKAHKHELVSKFHEYMVARFDDEKIRLGVPMSDEVISDVLNSQMLVVLINTEGFDSQWLDSYGEFDRKAIETALENKKRVIPILIDGAAMPSADTLPSSMASFTRRMAIPLDAENFDAEIAKLEKAIEKALQDEQSNTSPPQPSPVNASRLTNTPSPPRTQDSAQMPPPESSIHSTPLETANPFNQTYTSPPSQKTSVYPPVHLREPEWLKLAIINTIAWGGAFALFAILVPVKQSSFRFSSDRYIWDYDFGAGSYSAMFLGFAFAGFVLASMLEKRVPGTHLTRYVIAGGMALGFTLIAYSLDLSNNSIEPVNSTQYAIYGVLAQIISLPLAYWVPSPVEWWRISNRAFAQLLGFGTLWFIVLFLSAVGGFIALGMFVGFDTDMRTYEDAKNQLLYTFGFMGLTFGFISGPVQLRILRSVAKSTPSKNIQIIDHNGQVLNG